MFYFSSGGSRGGAAGAPSPPTALAPGPTIEKQKNTIFGPKYSLCSRMHHLKFPEEHSPDTSRAHRRYKEQWLCQQWGIGLYIIETIVI